MTEKDETLIPETSIVEEFKALKKKPSQRQWAAWREYCRDATPDFLTFIEGKERLRREEKDICLLLRLQMPLKQIIVVMDISFQHLYLIRKRLLKKVYGMEGNGRDFDAKIKEWG